MIYINDFNVQKECIYKGELYSVRDNGSIMRHQREGKKKRPQDDKWTFGTSTHNGYAMFCGEGVHRIVATAFHGEAPSEQHIVDHYDTNRQNNRPENLRWLTKLENILNNPYTRDRVIHICGSIENFLENPNLLFGHEFSDKNFTWMRAVTAEEAKNTLERMDNWLAMPYKEPSKLDLGKGEWIYTKTGEPHKYKRGNTQEKRIEESPVTSIEQTSEPDNHESNNLTWDDIREQLTKPYSPISTAHEEETPIKPAHDYIESDTPNALQDYIRWNTPTEFPLCPSVGCNLDEYMGNLTKGTIVTINKNTTSCVEEAVIIKNDKNSFISVICKHTNPNCIKEWSLIKIYPHEGKFAHECMGTFFHKDGVQKYHTLAQGKKWKGGDVFDDYC